MMKVFSERRSRAFEPAGGPDPAPRSEELRGDDRLAKGFELLFGTHLERQRSEIARIEGELGGRFEQLQTEVSEQARVLVALSDKASASLEREQDAERRRKGVEAELRQGLVELREAVRSSLSELHAKASELERSFADHLRERQEAERAGEDPRQQEALLALEARIETLEARAVERGSLAELLVRTARELEPKPGE